MQHAMPVADRHKGQQSRMQEVRCTRTSRLVILHAAWQLPSDTWDNNRGWIQSRTDESRGGMWKAIGDSSLTSTSRSYACIMAMMRKKASRVELVNPEQS